MSNKMKSIFGRNIEISYIQKKRRKVVIQDFADILYVKTNTTYELILITGFAMRTVRIINIPINEISRLARFIRNQSFIRCVVYKSGNI